MSYELGPVSAVVRSSKPLTATVDDEVVMLSPDRGAYFGLNRVGSRIWELLTQPRQVADLCDALTAEFDVDGQTCQAETLAFVRRLERADLIEVVPTASATTGR